MSKQPNILFIMTDQHRLSAVGAYGDTPCKTPNIDRLASEGILFQNTYTTYPVCSPARGSIMTGLYPHSHGITANIHEIGCSVHEIEDSPSLLPRRLQTAGYNTGYTGKWHLGTDKSLPKDIGFVGQNFPGHGGGGDGYSEYVEWLKERGYNFNIIPWNEKSKMIRNEYGILNIPTECTVPAYLVDKSMEMIDGFQTSDNPFFLSLNFWGPHSPYHATQEFIDMYRDISIPSWPNFEWDSRNTPGPHHYKIHWNKENFSWEDWEVAVKYYYARTSMIDSQIGRLYNYLEKNNQLENTIIIFTSDHGETLGSHGGLLDKGWHHFEEIQRIPLIIRMPDGSGKGKESGELASLADIYPTIMDIAEGRDYSEEVHGRSLLPLIQGEKTDWRESIVTEFLGLGNVGTCMKTIRNGNIKYGYNLTFPDELYDLDKDPHEMNNLVGDSAYKNTVQEMKDRLEEWMLETSDPALRSYRWHQKQNIDI